jgi:hypothetical protein
MNGTFNTHWDIRQSQQILAGKPDRLGNIRTDRQILNKQGVDVWVAGYYEYGYRCWKFHETRETSRVGYCSDLSKALLHSVCVCH